MLEFLPILAACFVIAGTFFLIQKHKLVWLMFSLANLMWIAHGSFNSTNNIVCYFMLLNIINLIGALEWGKQKGEQNAVH